MTASDNCVSIWNDGKFSGKIIGTHRLRLDSFCVQPRNGLGSDRFTPDLLLHYTINAETFGIFK